MTREKGEILQLRGSLPSAKQLSLPDLQFQEAIGAGSFGKVYRGVFKGHTVAIKRYRPMALSCKSEVHYSSA